MYGDVTEKVYVDRFRRLRREANRMQEETGSNYLYLTLGAMVHPTANGEARAPLFVLPVRIEGGRANSPFQIVDRGDGVANPNYCLIEWLKLRHRLHIPELTAPILDDSGIDIVKSLRAIKKSLYDNNLNYRIEESASVRLLQFSTFQMWKDLTDNWRKFTENPVVNHLTGDCCAPRCPPVSTTCSLPVMRTSGSMRTG
ncbi:MAG: DUF4011 domain-containing protein [Sciscionella sp.]